MEYAPLPPLQEPVMIHINGEILVVLLPDHLPHVLDNVRIQRQLPQPSSLAPRLPLLVRLGALHPVGALAGDGVEGTLPEEAPLNQEALVVVPWGRGVQHVKHRRVVEQRLAEPREEDGGAVQDVGREEDEHVRPHLPDVAEDDVPGARAVDVGPLVHQILKADTVDDEHLIAVDVEIVRTDGLPLGCDATELECHSKLTSAVAEAAPGRLDLSGWAEAGLGEVDAGDPHLRRPALPVRQTAQQSWPLEAVAHAVFHNVQLLPPRGGVADGRDGELECHHLEAAGCQVQPAGLEVLRDRDALRHCRRVQLAP